MDARMFFTMFKLPLTTIFHQIVPNWSAFFVFGVFYRSLIEHDYSYTEPDAALLESSPAKKMMIRIVLPLPYLDFTLFPLVLEAESRVRRSASRWRRLLLLFSFTLCTKMWFVRLKDLSKNFDCVRTKHHQFREVPQTRKLLYIHFKSKFSTEEIY